MGFAALVPGTIAGGWNDIHISGSPATTYRVFMDGLDDTSAVKGAISDEQQPSVESLASESLLINNYSAKFGESGGRNLQLHLEIRHQQAARNGLHVPRE